MFELNWARRLYLFGWSALICAGCFLSSCGDTPDSPTLNFTMFDSERGLEIVVKPDTISRTSANELRIGVTPLYPGVGRIVYIAYAGGLPAGRVVAPPGGNIGIFEYTVEFEAQSHIEKTISVQVDSTISSFLLEGSAYFDSLLIGGLMYSYYSKEVQDFLGPDVLPGISAFKVISGEVNNVESSAYHFDNSSNSDLLERYR